MNCVQRWSWLIVLVFFCQPALGFVTGFNQGWFKDNYAQSFLDSKFDAVESQRLLMATRDAGARVLRVWLFEGNLIEQFEYPGSGPQKIRPEIVKNFRTFLKLASELDVQIYLTLFDGNISLFSNTPEVKNRYWNVLNNKFGHGQMFLENVLLPILELDRELPQALFAIDLANEVNAFLKPKGGPWFEAGWQGPNTFANRWRAFIHTHSRLRVTASLGWGDAENQLINERLAATSVDFFDFHVYNDEGRFKNCRKLYDFGTKYRKAIYLGEFGQQSKMYSDELQNKITKNFLMSAVNCGLAGAFAWRLSESLPTNRQGDRFSFESQGHFRPAYSTIEQFGWAHP